MRLRARFLSWLWRRFDRLGYGCLGIARRVQAHALNEAAKQPSMPLTASVKDGSTSGSSAQGESGGRRCPSRALAFDPRHNMSIAFQMFIVGRRDALAAAEEYARKVKLST